MARLVILLGPVGSACGGIALGSAFEFLILDPIMATMFPSEAEEKSPDAKGKKAKVKGGAEKEKKDEKAKKTPTFGKKKKKASVFEEVGDAVESIKEQVTTMKAKFNDETSSKKAVSTRAIVGVGLFVLSIGPARAFYGFSHMFAEQSSRPQIMFKAQLQNGEWIMVDDYREAYHWLRDSTPKDARVMAWWDYGYQIAGIAKRTSIADGNTWNHEHIATLGRILTAPEDEAHSLARHLADYVLVWAGGGGDDLAKSPHLARIGNSVFPGHCSDPTCSQFGFLSGGPGGTPTPMMSKSLLYKMCQHGRPGVTVNSSYFEHVYTSKYGKVRIFKVKKVSKKSKDWIADPANKICDAPGSWYCTGQYPPALQSFVSQRRAFKQLEDFNVKKDAHSKAYHEEYMRRMGGGGARKGEL